MKRRWLDSNEDRRRAATLDGRELEVVDSLIAATWPKARAGEAAAVDRMMRLMEMREKVKEKEWGREVARQSRSKKSEG